MGIVRPSRHGLWSARSGRSTRSMELWWISMAELVKRSPIFRIYVYIYIYMYIFMDIYGYLWIFMDIYGYLWIFMDIYGRSIELLGGFLSMCLGCFFFELTPSLTWSKKWKLRQFPRKTIGFPRCFPRASTSEWDFPDDFSGTLW